MVNWREVLQDPKPAEIAFLFMLFVVAPLYLMVRVEVGARPGGGERDGGRTAGERSRPARGHEGLIPFKTNDIDPEGLLQVHVPAPVTVRGTPKRNIFNFARRKRTPAPRAAAPPPRPAPTPASRPEATEAQPKKPEEVVRPIEGFEYFGIIRAGDTTIAALKKNDRIFLAEPGDIVEAKRAGDDSEKKPAATEDQSEGKGNPAKVKYLIHKVGPKDLVIGYPGKEYRKTIPFEKTEGAPNQSFSTGSSRSRRYGRSRGR